MTGISGKQGKELLVTILDELRNLDFRIIPFDSDEVLALEYGVAQGVRDVFGSGSPEYTEFENFRIAAGSISRGDSRSEKQSKYELGLPRAVERLEELVKLIDESEEQVRDLSPEDLVEVQPAAKAPTKASPPKAVPRTRSSEPEKKADQKDSADEQVKTQPRAPARATVPVSKIPSPSAAGQPGRILLLQEGGDDISAAVAALLDKVGIGTALPEGGGTGEMEGILGLKDIAFTIMAASSEPRGGLSGLTSVIGKPHPRHETAFKLGLLVGVLGPGRVVILHGGERAQDIPEDLFGIRYIPYKEEGGWQIGLLKLLKASGFNIDANLLFD